LTVIRLDDARAAISFITLAPFNKTSAIEHATGASPDRVMRIVVSACEIISEPFAYMNLARTI
jgi:hypothetical protein